MIVELHMIQNFAPANLNRDDTGSPKDCEFGGYRRARISSQCQKRAIRQEFRQRELLPIANIGQRTKRLVDTAADRLAQSGRDREAAVLVAEAAVEGAGLGLKDRQTQYLLFLGEDEIDHFVTACEQHWDTLAEAGPAEAGAKKSKKSNLPKETSDDLRRVLNGRKGADVALFGRMLADLPDQNRNAASQVAHALSTNALTSEFDFFTAVDDLKPMSEDAGAGMLGTVEFNSSCFYRYLNLDIDQLCSNLGNDGDLVKMTVEALLRAAVSAVPTGKQNSFAAQNPPSMVMAVVRDAGVWSLANAFVKPVSPNGKSDLVGNSISALDDYWARLVAMYGDGGIIATPAVIDSAYVNQVPHLKESLLSAVDALVERVLDEIGEPCGQGKA